jgi:hypothetical protein
MKLWRSLAAWYSAFSDRSPWARASAIALITSWRSSFFSRLSSSSRPLKPEAVMGIFSIGQSIGKKTLPPAQAPEREGQILDKSRFFQA